MRDSSNTHQSGYRGRNFKENYSSFKSTGTTPPPTGPTNTFDKERLENAAKREQRGQNGTMVGGRGGMAGSGTFSSKQVRFSDATEHKSNGFTTTPPSSAPNPFLKAAPAPSSTFGSAISTPFNPFAKPEAQSGKVNGVSSNGTPFGAPSEPETASNPFEKAALISFSGPTQAASAPGSFSSLNATTNPFGAPSQIPAATSGSTTFGTTSTSKWPTSSSSAFGTAASSNPFAKSSTTPGNSNAPLESKASVFGASTPTGFPSMPSTFGTSAGSGGNPFGSAQTSFGTSGGSGTASIPFGGFSKTVNGTPAKTSVPAPSNTQSSFSSFNPRIIKTDLASTSNHEVTKQPESSALSVKIDQALRRAGVVTPQIPPYDIMANKQLLTDPAMGKYSQNMRKHKEKVREVLMREGIIDDPDKPKRLSEAIDFKGTCEEMCPQFEIMERLLENRDDSFEKEVQPDGSLSRRAVPAKMIKVLARSSAGQDAPLPSDVRTVATLRRTLDYLMQEILVENGIAKAHNFLWNRTRALRRDFVFHSYFTNTELVHQVYCLETIARFHAIALNEMAREENLTKSFDTYQEKEQLRNTMVSLYHAYEDCKAQGVACENRAEFLAYWVIIQKEGGTSLLETVQNWGWEAYESKEIQVAISLVEALQNTWALQGPLAPNSATEMAQNAFSRFFTIVKQKSTSYTMACFAAIWFHDARQAIMTTILTSYRKQRDQTKDWTLARLNKYLQFDHDEEVMPWAQLRGVKFDEVNGEFCLSFDTGTELTQVNKPPQVFSHALVDRKRGAHSVLHVMYHTVFEDESVQGEEEEGLFVKDNPSPSQPPAVTSNHASGLFQPGILQDQAQSQQNFGGFGTGEAPALDKGLNFTSIFDRVAAPATAPKAFSFGSPPTNTTTKHSETDAKPDTPTHGASSSFAAKPAGGSSSVQPHTNDPPSIFTKRAIETLPSIFSQPSQPAQPSQPSAAKSPATFPLTPSTSVIAAATAADTPNLPSVFDQQASASQPLPPTLAQPTQHAQSAQPSFRSFPQPKQPSPLSQSFGPPVSPAHVQQPIANSPIFPQSTTPKVSPKLPIPAVVLQEPLKISHPAVDPIDPFAGLTDWFALGSDGVMEQFTAYQVEMILRETVAMHMEEQEQAAIKEAETLARNEADLFRFKSLATKYGYLWREAAHHLWQKRRGREARKARREMAESSKATKAALSASVVEDFRASTTRRRRDSLQSLLGASGVLNGVHDVDHDIRAIVKHDSRPSSKRQRSDQSTNSQSSSVSKHKRGKSENPLRRSMLADPTYLSGESRIHLMSQYDTADDEKTQVSGVQTDYFRLKARGISTLHDGTPLASSVAKHTLHHKRSLDGFVKPSTPLHSRDYLQPRSVPAKRTSHAESESGEEDEGIRKLKERARAVVADDKKSRQKRTFVDDEELFARAKRIREQMDEGAQWFRKEVDRGSASRSGS